MCHYPQQIQVIGIVRERMSDTEFSDFGKRQVTARGITPPEPHISDGDGDSNSKGDEDGGGDGDDGVHMIDKRKIVFSFSVFFKIKSKVWAPVTQHKGSKSYFSSRERKKKAPGRENFISFVPTLYSLMLKICQLLIYIMK